MRPSGFGGNDGMPASPASLQFSRIPAVFTVSRRIHAQVSSEPGVMSQRVPVTRVASARRVRNGRRRLPDRPKESIMISQGNHSAADAARISRGGLKNSGIIVLAADRKVLYINQTGRDLLLRLNGREKRHAPGGLPKPLAALVEEIQASREISMEHRGWRRFGPKRLLEPQGRFLFVQAFVQPREPHRPRPVMVLTMQSGESPAPSMEREDPGR